MNRPLVAVLVGLIALGTVNFVMAGGADRIQNVFVTNFPRNQNVTVTNPPTVNVTVTNPPVININVTAGKVSTYMVVREAPFPTLTYCCGFVQVTVQAECNAGDFVTGGGYEIPNGYEWTSSNANPGDGFGEIFVQSSGPYTSGTTGAQGWSALAFASPMGTRQPPSPDISLRVTAICLHQG